MFRKKPDLGSPVQRLAGDAASALESDDLRAVLDAVVLVQWRGRASDAEAAAARAFYMSLPKRGYEASESVLSDLYLLHKRAMSEDESLYTRTLDLGKRNATPGVLDDFADLLDKHSRAISFGPADDSHFTVYDQAVEALFSDVLRAVQTIQAAATVIGIYLVDRGPR